MPVTDSCCFLLLIWFSLLSMTFKLIILLQSTLNTINGIKGRLTNLNVSYGTNSSKTGREWNCWLRLFYKLPNFPSFLTSLVFLLLIVMFIFSTFSLSPFYFRTYYEINSFPFNLWNDFSMPNYLFWTSWSHFPR